MSCKVGNQTNSQDPQAVNSRVFVGNLNTFQCSKTDVERMFQRYGRIAGISMHKGYAFIQFTNPFDARSSCLGEDGRLLWGQTLDVNMVAEPKAHQTGRKRQNIAKTGNDWDYYYDSYYAQVGFPTPRLVPPMKRARLHVPPTPTPRQPIAKPPSPKKIADFPSSNPSSTTLSDLKSYSTPDILICGNCRELFSEIEQLMEHKKNYCKLRFTCKCHMLNGCKAKTPGEEPASLLCSQCKDSFHSAWDLMVHVQAAHMLNIYQLSSTENTPNNGSIITTTNIRDLHEGKEENGNCCSAVGVGTDGTSMSMALALPMSGTGTGNGDVLMEDSSSASSHNLLLHSHTTTSSHSQGSQSQSQSQTPSQTQSLSQNQNQNQNQGQNQSQSQSQGLTHLQQLQQQHQQHLQQLQQQQQLQLQLLTNNNNTNINNNNNNTSSSNLNASLSNHSFHLRESSASSVSTMDDGHSPCGVGVGSSERDGVVNCLNNNNLNEILMETNTLGTTPERQMNGIGVSSSSCTSAATTAATASTQTLLTDNPTNFDDHCGLLSTMKTEGGAMSNSKHVPFSNGQPAGV